MRRVVIVTDADCKALEAVEKASENLNVRCISLTGCRHPDDSRWTPAEVEELILSTPHDPVVVLVDDEGEAGEGWGERLIRHLVASPKVKVMGVVAVASAMSDGRGARVNASINAQGEQVASGVNKEGAVERSHEPRVYGDTVENLDDLGIPIVIGIGDPGKMNFADDAKNGAPITTKALAAVLHAHAERELRSASAVSVCRDLLGPIAVGQVENKDDRRNSTEHDGGTQATPGVAVVSAEVSKGGRAKEHGAQEGGSQE